MVKTFLTKLVHNTAKVKTKIRHFEFTNFETGTVISTDDNGETWKVVPVSSLIKEINLSISGQLICGGNNKLVYTYDSGNNWRLN